MTVAPEHPIPPALRGGRRVRLTRRCEHALIVLGICLPVPLLAATGLSIPLPATVERLAAALVPWADAEALDENELLASGVSGSIVHVPDEEPADAATPSAAANPRSATLASLPSHPKGGSGGSDAKDDGEGSAGSGDSGGSGGSTSNGGEPTDPASPVQDTVDQVSETTQPVVDDVEGTVTDVVGQADDTVDGVLSGLGK
jgi:hypothetical protein